MTPWDPNVCLGFLYQLLKYVQATVVKNHNRSANLFRCIITLLPITHVSPSSPFFSAVYEFSCAKDGPGFSSKEIPAEEAFKAGHEYLTEDMDSFLR